MLYAGEPQNERIIQYGPFVAETEQDVARLFGEDHAGEFTKLSQLTAVG